MYLMIYDSNLTALGAVDVFDTVIWVRRDTEYGSFEITAPATENNLNLLVKYNIVQKDNDNEIGFINSIQITGDLEKGDVIKATGLFYCGVLKQRCVLANATNLKSLIENNLRGLNLISVDNAAATIVFANNFVGENLGECITALAKAQGFGFETVLNSSTRKIDFKIYYGTDRSILQTVNPYTIFSDNYENLFDIEYVNSDIGIVNVVYVRCKLPEGVLVYVSPLFGDILYVAPELEIANNIGVDATEKYVTVDIETYDLEIDAITGSTDISASEGNTIKRTFFDSAATNAKISAAINAEIVETQENFQGTVDFKLKYRAEYDLGDIVTVKNDKWGKVISQRITEVTEVYDNTSNAITPTFGNPARTIMDILKKVK